MKKLTKILSFAFVVLFAGIVLAGCTPANIDKAKAKMEEAGYTVVAYDQGKDAEGFVGGFMATNISLTSGVDAMVAILFETSADAKEFSETWTGNYEGKQVFTEGKWVYTGSEDAIEAFKK